MRWLKRLVTGATLVLLLLGGVFWWLTQASDSVPRAVIPFSDLRKYRQWLEDYHPARLAEGETYRITLTDEDIQKLAILLASTQPALAHSQFKATLDDTALTLDVWWPTRVLERFLPIRLVWRPDAPFSIRELAVGGLPLPNWALRSLNARLHRQAAVEEMQRFWRQLSPSVRLRPGEMTVSVDWGAPEQYRQLQDFAPFWADPRQKDRLVDHVVWLRDWLAAQNDFRIPLRTVLPAMMQREQFDWDRDAPAMLGALAYASLGRVSGLYPGEDLPELPFRRFTLHDRYDLARHFLLTMWLGTQMNAESVLELATYKEWSDALTRRSGFSHEDMIANVSGLELLDYLRRLDEDGRQEFRPPTDDLLMPPSAFWEQWAIDDAESLTERQIRDLVQATRSWLGNNAQR